MFLQRGRVLEFPDPCGAEDLLYGFEVDSRERADVEAHFVESRRVELLGCGGDGGFFAEDDAFRYCGVVAGVGEEAPVHVASVAEIGVICFVDDLFEDFHDEIGAFCGAVEEEFHGGCE